MDEYKRCPDCAEMVRAQARRCRFCGYRFERYQPPALSDLLRRAPPTATLVEVLEGWGTDLAAGEGVEFFGFCRMDGDDGYLLITSLRVRFHVSRRARVLVDWRLTDVLGVEVARRRGVRVLRVTGPGRAVGFTRFASRGALADAADRMRGGISPTTT